MKKLLSFLQLCAYTLCAQLLLTNHALAYPNEVRQSGNSYIWRINDVDQGSTSDLATAINNCIGTGNREVHVLNGGTLSSQINLQPGLRLYCHNVTFNKNHSGYGFYRDGSGDIRIYDMILNNNSNMGIRTSRASDIYIQNVRIYGGSIGIRIDSHPSRPYEDGRWVYNVHIQDCRFENGGSHGLETYGVDGFQAYGIVARNMGECGVLLNKTINGTIGTVDAYRCSYGGGYAGLRYANSCANIVANSLIARECGRGYFVLTGSNNCRLNNAQITDCTNIGIWLENVVNCSVIAGCTNSGVAVSGSGSYANVSSSCSSGGGGTYYKIQNRGTGLVLDGMGRTVNGDDCGQYASSTNHFNAQWEMIATGSYYQFRNRGTGLLLDGMGRTTNGSALGQYANTTHVNAQWSVQTYSGSYQRIQNRGTGLFIDGMGLTANGSTAGQYSSSGHVNQQWQLVAVSGTASNNTTTDRQSMEITQLGANAVKVLTYPNPAIDEVNISLPEDYNGRKTLRLYDMMGKISQSAVFNGNRHTISIRHLPAGVYMLKIEAAGKEVVQRIVKSNN